MATLKRTWVTFILLMLLLYSIATGMLIYAGVNPLIAVIDNLLGSLQVYYSLIKYKTSANPFVLISDLLDTVVFAILTVLLASWFFDFISNVSIRERFSRSRIRGLKNHVILAPYNSFAESLANEFKDAGMKTVGIAENRRELVNLYKKRMLSIAGDLHSKDTFMAAGISSAKYLIACSEDDLQNALIAITAREVNPHAKVIARVSKEENIPKLDVAGAHRMILAEITTGQRIAEEIVKRL